MCMRALLTSELGTWEKPDIPGPICAMGFLIGFLKSELLWEL